MGYNIYGGITKESSPFIFDLIYENYAQAINSASTDQVMFGRYVLIKYCDTLFDYSKRMTLENLSQAPLDPEENKYYRNYWLDGGVSYDRMILQKTYTNGVSLYEPITCLHIIRSEEYSEDIMNEINKFKGLNLENGLTEKSIQIKGNNSRGLASFAGGQETEVSGNYALAYGYGLEAKYNNELVVGSYNLLPYSEQVYITDLTRPLFEVGTSNIIDEKHSGLILDHTNSIIHQNRGKKMKLIKGWKAISTSFSTVNRCRFKVNSIDGLLDDNGNAKYSTCCVVLKNKILLGNQVILSTIDKVTNYITLQFSPALDTSIGAQLIGIYIDEEKDLGPDILCGENNFLSGDILYRSLGNSASAFGYRSLAQGQYSLSTGETNQSFGIASFSEGVNNKAIGDYSHAAGKNTSAIGYGSSSHGNGSSAEGKYSISLGEESVAVADHSIAAGNHTISKTPYSMTIGQYNKESTDSYFQVGVGTLTERKTGFYIDSNGFAYSPYLTAEAIETLNEKSILINKEYFDLKEQVLKTNIEANAEGLEELNENSQKSISYFNLESADYIIETGTVEVPQTNFYLGSNSAPAYGFNTTLTWQYEKWNSGKLILTTMGNFWNLQVNTMLDGYIHETEPVYIKFPWIAEFSDDKYDFTIDLKLKENSSGLLRPTKYINNNISVLFGVYSNATSSYIGLTPSFGGKQSFWISSTLTTDISKQGTWPFTLYRLGSKSYSRINITIALKIEAYWKAKEQEQEEE